MVKFRITWWFKRCGKGSKDPITIILNNIKDICVESNRRKISEVQKWIPPITGFKFNVDGSSRGSPGHGGIGGVLRDSGGRVVCIFSAYVGTQDSNTAELFAIYRACSFYASSPR